MASARARSNDLKVVQTKSLEHLGWYAYIRNNSDTIISDSVFLTQAEINGSVYNFVKSSGVAFEVASGTYIKDMVITSLFNVNFKVIVNVNKTAVSDSLVVIKDVSIDLNM